jgi:vancomycin permeability regulator SanA
MKKILKYIIGFSFLWFVVHELVIIYDGLTDESNKADVIVILGNKVNEDGSLSNRLKARLDKGLELYSDSLAPLIFVSGGLGIEGHLEGSKMAEYLIVNGVKKEFIIIDNKGDNTQLTANNFKSQFSDVQDVLVISQYYHISRTKLAFRNRGIQNVYGAHCDYYELRDLYGLFREFFGYYKYLIFK